MRRLQQEVREVVRREGVIARRSRPELGAAIDRLLRAREIVAPLPGVYCDASRSREWEIRLTAAYARPPDAVLVNATAARLPFSPTLHPADVEIALGRECAPRAGFTFYQRKVPAELVCERAGLRITTPALTALDLCATSGGDGIDRALLTRTATLAGMRRAIELTGGRRGNRDRRALPLDSRDEPWSAAERLCHRLLRDAGVGGWRSNLPVRVAGDLYYLDVGFARLRLAVEIDGRFHEFEEETFESDRRRQNALVLDGWTVLRFTWRMLTEQPESVIAAIRDGLAMCG